MNPAKYQCCGDAVATEQSEVTAGRIVDTVAAVDGLIDVNEAASFLGLPPASVYHMVSQGRLPHFKLSTRCLRFRRSELEKFISKNLSR